jgi:hypothetical protein
MQTESKSAYTLRENICEEAKLAEPTFTVVAIDCREDDVSIIGEGYKLPNRQVIALRIHPGCSLSWRDQERIQIVLWPRRTKKIRERTFAQIRDEHLKDSKED